MSTPTAWEGRPAIPARPTPRWNLRGQGWHDAGLRGVECDQSGTLIDTTNLFNYCFDNFAAYNVADQASPFAGM